MRRAIALLTVLSGFPAAGRLEIALEAVDLPKYLAEAPMVAQVEVLRTTDRPAGTLRTETVSAQLRVHRWYRGGSGEYAEIRFVRPALRTIGHFCTEFDKAQFWLVLAKERDGMLELVDDCYAAFPVSARLAAENQNRDLGAQLEADFRAGVDDPSPRARVESLARLGNLRRPSSLPVLDQWAEMGRPEERKAATYAAELIRGRSDGRQPRP